MRSVKKSSTILHVFNLDPKGLGWGGLIFAAQSEIERIQRRIPELQEAIDCFKKKEAAGEVCPTEANKQHKIRAVPALRRALTLRIPSRYNPGFDAAKSTRRAPRRTLTQRCAVR